MGLDIGDAAPHFTLNDQHGKVFDSKDHIGKKPLVLFFYPKDYTPGCTKEACSFRDSYEEFTEEGAEVIGISADSESSHRKFASTYKLPFILLADTRNKVRKLFKVEKALFNLLPGHAARPGKPDRAAARTGSRRGAACRNFAAKLVRGG